jgi:hypothetical protein
MPANFGIAFEDMEASQKEELQRYIEKYSNDLKRYSKTRRYHIPFFNDMIDKYYKVKTLEAIFFFYKTEDPEIDRHMIRAFMIRDYEMRFHFMTGLAWGLAFLTLPAWQKFKFATSVSLSSAAFGLAMYRGFRRGYDQVEYVGETFMEMHIRKNELLKYMRDHDDYLPEFREHLIESKKFYPLLQSYGLLED